jgi:hypothetical protein
VITPYDEYPIHQTAEPVAHPASGDPNHYDRYFFNGFSEDGTVFFAAAMGHYPNRAVIDAAFSVVEAGRQRSVFASGRMPADRSTTVGPITVEPVEPLRTIRLSVGPNEHGLEATLGFEARTPVVEEPRNTVVAGARRVMDSTRMTQWGRWNGRIRVDGREVEVGSWPGVRDRSWGQRTVGVQAPTNHEPQTPQLFWLWAPLHFERFCTHLAVFEYADGRRWLEQGLVVPILTPSAATWGPGAPAVEHLESVGYSLSYVPGTRLAASASLHLDRQSADPLHVELTPLLTFRMRGIGYTHPVWGHGSIHGDLEIGGESCGVDELDPSDFSSIHVQSVVRAQAGDNEGIGVLEQLAFGDHEPTGLSGLLDGWRPQ